MSLTFQALQDKVCEFQARLCSEDITHRLLLQHLQDARGGEVTLQGGRLSAAPSGEGDVTFIRPTYQSSALNYSCEMSSLLPV